MERDVAATGAGRFGRTHFEIHDDRFLTAADDNRLAGFVGAGVDFLVGHVGRYEDEVAGAGFVTEFQLIAPAHASPAPDYVEDSLQFAVVVGTGFGVGLNDDGSGPELTGAGAGVGDGGGARHSGSLRGVRIQVACAHDFDAMVLPVFTVCDHRPIINCVILPAVMEHEKAMERKKASDYPQELLNLFDKYVHGDIDRRDFFEGAKKFAVGGLTAATIFESLRPNYAWAEQIKKDDKRVITEYVTVPSPKGNESIKGYLVRPAKAAGKLPGVLVVHENRGLNPYIEDVARRFGTENFIAFAPDGLTSVGGYPGDDEKGGALFAKVDKPKMTEDFIAAARWLKARPDCSGKIGAVGFCFGGGIANTLAVRMGADLNAAVPFYGGQPKPEEVANIKAPLLLHYASLDTRLTGGWPAYEEALKANQVTYTGYVYEGANHGFHNDTTPRYDEAAAKLAWQRTLDFFNKYLR
jgi:carboxymethylenebutenolidase